MSAVAERTARVAFLTTLSTNIGDDWIREGVRAVLDRVIPGYSPLLINKWSQGSLRVRAEEEREEVLDKYWESDLFVIAGAPVYWHLTGGRHRSLEAEWHKWMYADRILAGGDDEHPPLLNLGAGSGQPWGDDGSAFVNDAACAAFARELGWRAALTTVRERTAAAILKRLDVPHRLLPCPAFLAPLRANDASVEVSGRIGVNLMHLGGHFALDDGFSHSRWREACAAMVKGLRSVGELVFICHDQGEQRFMEPLARPGEGVFIARDWREYHALYASCAAVVANRVHGAVYAAGCGTPSVILGNDSRAQIGEPIGLRVERSATIDAGAVIESVRALVASREAEADRLRDVRDRTVQEYVDLIRPIAEGLAERPRRTPRTVSRPAATRKLAFITGCAGSGTTLLGRVLEHHGQVRYFDNRFDLWARPFPFTDIWGYHPGTSLTMPRLALDEEDARVAPAAREWFLGLLEAERGDRPVLVEKLAVHNFRLSFVTALCPDAYLINIVRNGVDVARSIAASIEAGRLDGDRKWRLLVEHAWSRGYGPLLRWSTTPYHRGLLEWRMSVEAAEASLKRAAPSRVLHVRYEELCASPADVCEQLREFLGLSESEGMERFARQELRASAESEPWPKGTREIAGETLERLGTGVIINLYKHRGYIWRTAWLDVRNRYAGAGLGPVWNLLQPLAMILVFTLVFTKIMSVQGDLGAPYPVYLCTALLPWMAFAECINRGTHAFIANAPYLRRLPVPEQVFVAQTAVSTAIGLTLSFALLVIVSVVLGHAPSWHWLLLPVPLLLLIGMGFGLGMALGTVNAFIRDVGQIVPIVMQVWFWLYPVVYRIENLPEGLRRTVPFNPIYPYMESIRALFIQRQLPTPTMWMGMLAWTVAAGLIGYLVLRRLRPELRDVI